MASKQETAKVAGKADLEKHAAELQAEVDRLYGLLAEVEPAVRVADTTLARRDVEREIAAGMVGNLRKDSPYWHKLMRKEVAARSENDQAIAVYRKVKSTLRDSAPDSVSGVPAETKREQA
jgi:hypothetical protein